MEFILHYCNLIDLRIIITLVLLSIAFIAKAGMDISAKGGFSKAWWNKSESWELKYELPLRKGVNWWYFGLYRLLYQEKFPFSSTIFVCFTDGWHFLQLIFLNLMFIALSINLGVSIPDHIFFFLIIRMLYAVTFNPYYNEHK